MSDRGKAGGTEAPYRYDRREIGFFRPDPVLHARDCPDAPPDAHAVGFWPLYGTLDVAASAVALRVHSCVPGADFSPSRWKAHPSTQG
jgi:hypothetical protein